MKKRMFQMLVAVLAVVATLGFVKFQQIQAAIAAGKAFTMPPEAVTSVVVKQDRWEGTLEAVGSVEPVQGVVLSAEPAGRGRAHRVRVRRAGARGPDAGDP